MVNEMHTRELNEYIGQLSKDLSRLCDVDQTANVKRFADNYVYEHDGRSVTCYYKGVEVSLLGGSARASWAVHYEGRGKNRIEPTADSSHFDLYSHVDQKVRQSLLEFARQIGGEVVSDFETGVEIEKYKLIDGEPEPTFVEDVSRFIYSLLGHQYHAAELIAYSNMLSDSEKAAILERISAKPRLNLGPVKYSELGSAAEHAAKLADALSDYMPEEDIVSFLSRSLTRHLMADDFQRSPEAARKILQDLQA